MSHEFCICYLRRARDAARYNDVKVPKHLTAMKSDRHYYFVEGDNMTGQFIEADCAYDAKAKLIYKLVDNG